MKRFILLLLYSLSIISCKTYIDVNKHSYKTDDYEFSFYPGFNEFYFYSKIYGVADNYIYYPTHFKVKLPKKLVTWGVSNNNFFFEYDSKQIIYVKSDYENLKEEENWIVYDNYDDIDKDPSFLWYWKERGYNSKCLSLKHRNRVSKKYSNGKIEIILFNIKDENVEEYLELVKSFKLIEYKK